MAVCLFQAIKLQLSDILADQDVLFNFMKFMKAEASVNVLQFYLSIGTSALKYQCRVVLAHWAYRLYCKWPKLEMWANAQRDGRPAEYRLRPLFNAAKFG